MYYFPGGSDDKASAYNVGHIMSTHSMLFPGKSHERRSCLVCYRPWGCRVGHDQATSLSVSFTFKLWIAVLYFANTFSQSLS